MPIPTTNKTLTLPSGLKYAYVYNPPTSKTKPNLLFLHGFPSTSADWRHQISHFRSQGYGILVPDLLGNGHTSKPLSLKPYLGSFMSADIISILDHEKITGHLVGIAHDWGTYLLSQLAARYQDRFEKFVFLSGPYAPPGHPMNVQQINRSTKRQKGYEQFGYWLFFTRDGAGKVIGKHWENFFHLAFCADPATWETDFVPINACENSITRDWKFSLAPYVTEEDKAHHHEMFGDDYSASLNWYHRGIRNLGVEEEKEQVKKGEIREKIAKETLFIAGLRDAASSPERGRIVMKTFVEGGENGGNLKMIDLDSSHWIMLEKAEEVNKILGDFFENGVGRVELKASL